MDVKDQLHAPFALLAGKVRDDNWIGNCVGTRAFMDF